MSIRKYMTVPELLADWRFLMRRWGYPETRDIDEIAQIIRER